MLTDAPLVIVGSGQSNWMANAASTGGTFRVNPHVQIWDAYQARWEVLDLDNVQHWSTDHQAPSPYVNAIGNGRNQIFGGMGQALYEIMGGREIRLISNGRGGVPLYYGANPGQDWVGNGTSSVRYVDMKTDVETALASLGRTTIDAMCFQQGESDFLNGRTIAQYEADFVTLVTQLRAESWFPATTPILCGEPCQDWTDTTNLANLMAAKAYLTSDADAYTTLVRSEGLPSEDPVSNSIHFSGNSLYLLGVRYAQALANFGYTFPRRHMFGLCQRMTT